MHWTDEHARILVEDVLGVRPDRIAILATRIERNHPAPERARALALAFVPRAMLSGIPSGLARNLRAAIAMGLIEERTALGHRASMIAALEYLEDPNFFARDDWPERVLLVDDGDGPLGLALREGARFVLRLVVMRTAHRATALAPRPFDAWMGGAAGALFNGIEMRAFAARALMRRTRVAAPVEVETAMEARRS